MLQINFSACATMHVFLCDPKKIPPCQILILSISEMYYYKHYTDILKNKNLIILGRFYTTKLFSKTKSPPNRKKSHFSLILNCMFSPQKTIWNRTGGKTIRFRKSGVWGLGFERRCFGNTYNISSPKKLQRFFTGSIWPEK